MKVTVDRQKCAGLGLCESFNPQVFHVGKDEIVVVDQAAITPELEEDILEAIGTCPTEALRLAGSPAPVETDLNLTVLSKREVAAGVVELVLGSSVDLPSWSPGAHIDLQLGEFVRQYSLCGDPRDRRVYRVAVLAEEQGRGGSQWAHDKLGEGDSVQVRGPRNHFRFDSAGSYLFIAGGIGITPLLPMIDQAHREGASWTLLYGGRRRDSMAYLDELAPHGAHVVVSPEDECGLLDLASVLAPVRPDTLIYCCGPEPLLSAIEAASTAWPAGALRLERFAAKKSIAHEDDAPFEVVFNRSGITATVEADQTVLDVASANGIFVPQSCSEGVCGTCETLVLEGEPDHRDSLYTAEDYAEGAFAPCVSRCKAGRLVVDL